jgi:type I restriction enzyme S subunit
MYGATIGETAILGVDAATNQACCALLPRDGRANSAHAFLFFLTNQRGLVSLSQGAAQNNVSQAVIRQYPMMMPPHSIMASFVDFVMTVLAQHRVLQSQIDSLVRARDLLLPRLMDGRIEV